MTQWKTFFSNGNSVGNNTPKLNCMFKLVCQALQSTLIERLTYLKKLHQTSSVRDNRTRSLRTDRMTGLVKVKHLEKCWWPVLNRTGPFHLTSNRRFRNLGLNGKRPSISMAAWIQAVKGCCGSARVDGLKEDLFWFALSLLFYLTFSTRLPSLHEHVIVQQYMVVVAALDWVENQFWFDFVLILFQFLYLSFNSKWKRKIVTNKMKIIKNKF